MIQIRAFLLSCLLTFTLLIGAQAQSLCHPDPQEQNLITAERTAHTHTFEMASKVGAAGDDYDLTYARLELKVDPAEFYISGAVTLYFEPLIPDFDSLVLDLSRDLEVDSIFYHGSSLANQGLNGDVFGVTLPAPINALDSITLHYQGVPPGGGLGSFAAETHRGSSILWTLSQPYGARDWWPCKQTLNDKINKVDLLVTVPDSFKVATNGLLLSETAIPDSQQTLFHWQHNYPIPAYLVAISVANYTEYSDWVVLGGDSLEIENFVYPENEMNARPASAALIPIFEGFDSLFGRYPYMNEKYGHAQFGWNGGMEHTTMSFVGDFGRDLLSHELAHQWFGNKVTCGSWQDIWLNEGFATYLTGLSYELLADTTGWENWKRVRVDYVVEALDGSVYVDDTTDIWRIFNGRLSYTKGAMVLHMLRWKLGDDLFYLGLRNFLNDPQLAFGYARTPDLQRHLEAAFGESLNEFFQDWVYGEGYPSYTVEWRQEEESPDLTVTLSQTTSHNSVDFYEMPVPILFSGAGRDSLVIFDHDSTGQVFSLQMPFQIERVTFDPEIWLISDDNEVWNLSGPQVPPGQLQVFPNPAKDVLEFKSGDASILVSRVEAMDGMGRLISFWDLDTLSAAFSMDVTDWPRGFYVLRLQTTRGLLVRKVWLR